MLDERAEEQATTPGVTRGHLDIDGGSGGFEPGQGGSKGRVPIPSDREWAQLLADLAAITDESDTDEIWDEVLRNLGVESIVEGE